MSSYDDWVVNFKVNTKPIDDALEKVNKLNQAISNLYGGGSGGGRGSGRGGSSTSSGDNPRRRRMTRTAEERAEIGAYQQDARRTRDLSRAEIQAYNEQERRVRAQNTAARRLAQAEIAAHNEDARRARDIGRASEQSRLAQARAYGNVGNNSSSWARRRAAAVGGLTAENPQARNMRSYYARQEQRDAQRRTNTEQMRQVQQAVEAAAERRRIAEIQQRRDMEQYNSAHLQRVAAERQGNRATRLANARERRNYALNRLESRARASGANIDQDALSALRSRIAGVRSFTQLDSLDVQMRQFADHANAATQSQNRLNRQMQQSGFAANAFTSSLKNMASSMLGVYAVIGVAKSLYDNAKEMESMQIKLLMGTGSKSLAAEEYSYIKKRAQETGTDISTMGALYGQLSMTGKDVGMSQKQLRKVFEDTTTMEIGFGLTPEQQKYANKAIGQMMSKQSVNAEDFKQQLSEHAPGLMGLLATSMGLPQGKEGQKILTEKMKKGQIGIDELFKFLDLAAKRAKESGAYGLAITSKQAAETRMRSSYKDFALAFGGTYDSNIKGIFQGLADTLGELTSALNASEKQQKETGLFGWNKDLLDGLTETVMMLGEVLETAAEGWFNLYAKITEQSANSTLKTFIADREMERNYFRSMGVTSEQAKNVVRANGMPGYQEYVQKNALSLGASKANAWLTSIDYAERAGLIGSSTKVTTQYGQRGFLDNLFNTDIFNRTNSITTTKDYPRNAPVSIAPTFYFTVQNNDEAESLWKNAMRELEIPYK